MNLMEIMVDNESKRNSRSLMALLDWSMKDERKGWGRVWCNNHKMGDQITPRYPSMNPISVSKYTSFL